MEYTTSSRFVTFMERPMPVTAFNFTRRLGFQIKYHNMNMPWWRVSAGITGQEIDGWEVRSNVVANMQRASRTGGPNFTGKVVLMPWATNPDQGLHIGYNFQHRSGRFMDDDEGVVGSGSVANDRGWHSMRVSARNSTAVNRLSFLDTRWIRGVRHTQFHGFELAGFWNSWRFGSEVIICNVIMDRNLHQFPTFTDAQATQAGFANADAMATHYAQNKRLWGFYFQAGKLLFGGRQRYDIRQSEFTQQTRGRSWGDIEVLFRYDFLNLNNSENLFGGDPRDLAIHRVLSAEGAATGQAGGAAHNFTFGISYLINNNMRFTVNYQISQTDRWANAGSNIDSNRRNVAVGRDAQGYFTSNPLNVVSNPGIGFNTLQMRFEMWF